MENPLSKALLSADDLMRVSWKLFQERFLKFVYVFLLSLVSFLFIATVLATLALASQSKAAVFLLLFLVFVAFLVIGLIQNVMFFEIIKNKNVRIRQAFRKAASKLRPYVGSLALYFLVALNLIVLFVFLGAFIFMSSVFAGLLSEAQGVAIVFGMMAAFLVFFMGVILTVLFIYAYVWQYFLFFDTLIGGMPVRDALDHSFSLVSRNKRLVFERAGVFFLFYVLVLVTLMVLSYINSVFGLIAEASNYLLCGWMVMFLYSMHENLIAAGKEKTDTSDRQAVSLLIRSGSVIAVTFVLLGIFSCVFFLAQTNLFNNAVEALSALQSSLFSL